MRRLILKGLVSFLVVLLLVGEPLTNVYAFVGSKESQSTGEISISETTPNTTNETISTTMASDQTFIDLGYPIQTAQTIDATFGVEDGVNVVYTTVTGSATSGDFAKFNVIDIDNQKLLNSYPLKDSSNAWSHEKTSDGRVYIGASKKLFVYSPETKEVTDLGIPINGTESIWSLTSDEDGNVYGGIYSASIGGRVFKVDASTLEVTDLLGEAVDSSENYIRSIAYYDGYIYAGTGSTNGRVWKINPVTKEKERIELPGSPENAIYNGKFNSMGAVYGMTVVNHYLFAFFNGPFTMHVYDLDAQKWRDTAFSNIRGLMAVTGAHNGKVYTSKKDGNMWEIDVETLTEKIAMPFDGSIRSSKWMDVANQTAFDGKAMVTISYDGKVVLYDPNEKKKVVLPTLVDGNPLNLQAIEKGPDGKIYISSYMGTEGATYDPTNDDKLANFSLAQAEGFGSVGETMYFGLYPGAEIFGWNTSQEIPQSGPDFLFEIDNGQDRPFVLREGGEKLLIGTIAGYSKHEGALTIYDPKSGKYDVYPGIVQNQSIAGLTYKDGIVYGSTTIHGGLGSAPVASKAKLFAFDMSKRQKIHEWNLEIDGLSTTIPMISGLTNGPDGLIWGAVNGFIFAFDPVTYQVVKSKNVYPDITNYGRWRPVKLYFGEDGLLYTNVGSRLTVLNPKTMESKQLVENEVNIFTMNQDNEVYFAQATKVMKKLRELPENLTFSIPDTATIGVSQEIAVSADFYDWIVDITKYVEFSVSNPEKVEIKDGKIIPKHAGEVTLTATYMGKELTKQVITVVEPKPVKSFLDVKNASFEEKELSGWTLTKGKSQDSFISTLYALSGKNSLQVKTNQARGKTEFLSDEIEVKEGKSYTVEANVFLSGDGKHPSKMKPSAFVGVYFYNELGDLIAVEGLDEGKITLSRHEWFHVKHTSLAPKGAVDARIVLNGHFGWLDELYYDDVSFSTTVDPRELPTVELIPSSSYDVAVGSDVSLSILAAEGTTVEVREGSTILATGVGAGEKPVELVIPSPEIGEHEYTVVVTKPGIGFVTMKVPKITVYELTNLSIKPEKIEMAVGEEKVFTVYAEYGPIKKDVTNETSFTTASVDIVELNRNKLTAVQDGNEVVIAEYAGKTAEVKVVVSSFLLTRLELTLPINLRVGETATATVFGYYKNVNNGNVEKRNLHDGVQLTITDDAHAFVQGLDITGMERGEVVVTAEYQGILANSTVNVYRSGDTIKQFLEVENADFEDLSEDDFIHGWSLRDGTEGYTSLELSEEQSLSGDNSLKLVDATTSKYTALQSDLIEIEIGVTYTTGANVYLGDPPINPDTGNAFSSSRTLYQIRYYDNNGKELSITSGLGIIFDSPRGQWLQKEFYFTAPENAAYVRILLSSSNAWVTTAYYDDVYIYRMQIAE
ncbi:WD40 repeat domain-containing protein [Bacillus sp. FJAT-18017]|uniref:WD40 repeat domain-containing protein n=1 Tax=Bacillus sp. FJAT-18017 TaxID=1705566 RepID=UPI0006AE42C8|nr:WD40 repeat domain-containing protein [Bacillus sp. FJAT-18017]